MSSSQTSSWQQLVQALVLVKRSWTNEERKYRLTMTEIHEIDNQFLKFTDVVNDYSGTPQEYSRFISEYIRLKRMIRRVETKMGNISLIILRKDSTNAFQNIYVLKFLIFSVLKTALKINES